jgi:hypothetical protein
MGALFDARQKIDRAIEERKLDAAAIRGQFALQTGFLLSLITQSTPDDPVRVEKLKKAALTLLQLRL